MGVRDSRGSLISLEFSLEMPMAARTPVKCSSSLKRLCPVRLLCVLKLLTLVIQQLGNHTKFRSL